MTTTSSTTSTTSTTSTGSAILTALSAGSGVDTSSLVTSLTSATYDPQVSAVTAKQTANTAEISAVSSVSSSISGFASVLNSLISGGTLVTQPTSSDSAVLTATAKTGAQVGSLSAQVSVQQVAQAQSVVSGYFANSATTVGTGTLTLKVGSTSTAVSLTSANNSLAGVARAINAAAAGLTASVVTDATGARLAIKGTTGASNAFTITAAPGSDSSLLKLAYPPEGMTTSGTSVVSADLADETTAAVGTGSFTLAYGSNSATVTIDSSNNTLDGMVSAINAAGVGLTASVATDSGGAHLVVTDSSGSATTAPSFTLTPASDADTGLSRFAFPATSTGMTQAQGAQDAIVRLNGVDVTRSSNTIDDLIDGVTLNVVSAAPSETVTLGATRPTAAIKTAVQNFVDYYNDLKSTIDGYTSVTTDADGTTTKGALYGVAGIRTLQQQLARLTSTTLNTSGGPSTLAEIGVETQNDGTLTLDTTALSTALTNYPDGVEALFNPTQHSSSALVRITSSMGATAAGTYTLTGLKAPTTSTNAQGTIDGKAGVPASSGTQLYASQSTTAKGLQIAVDGDVDSATVTVDLGLGGALAAITSSLTATNGVISALNTSLATQKTDLADQQTKLSDDEEDYRTRLTTQFTQMNTDVTNYKSILSYLQQQIAVWTKSDS